MSRLKKTLNKSPTVKKLINESINENIKISITDKSPITEDRIIELLTNELIDAIDKEVNTKRPIISHIIKMVVDIATGVFTNLMADYIKTNFSHWLDQLAKLLSMFF